VGPIHYTFTKNFIPSQQKTRDFKDLELPKEEKAGKNIASIRRETSISNQVEDHCIAYK
jgi:hypothetical protein